MKNTCKKCGETKDISLFPKHKKCVKGVRNECKKCTNLIAVFLSKSRPRKNTAERKEWRKEYYLKNKSALINKAFAWAESNKEKRLECQKKVNNRASETLADRYVKKALREKGFKTNQITPELIEVQRLIIKTKRLCKTSQI